MKCINFAHRGFSGKYPENTMIAFQKALEAGCDGIELDVHLTKDNEVVIIHDEKIDRTSNYKGIVKELTYKELTKIDFSYNYLGKVEFQKIPTLKEYLEFIKDKEVITNIELKTNIYEYIGIEEAVYDMICEYDLKNKVIISSFNHYSIKRIKEIDPDIKCGFLTESWIINAGEYTRKNGVEYLHPLYTMLNNQVLEELRTNDIKVNTWTVNDETKIIDIINKGVNGIISNYPDKVSKVLKQLKLK